MCSTLSHLDVQPPPNHLLEVMSSLHFASFWETMELENGRSIGDRKLWMAAFPENNRHEYRVHIACDCCCGGQPSRVAEPFSRDPFPVDSFSRMLCKMKCQSGFIVSLPSFLDKDVTAGCESLSTAGAGCPRAGRCTKRATLREWKVTRVTREGCTSQADLQSEKTLWFSNHREATTDPKGLW